MRSSTRVRKPLALAKNGVTAVTYRPGWDGILTTRNTFRFPGVDSTLTGRLAREERGIRPLRGLSEFISEKSPVRISGTRMGTWAEDACLYRDHPMTRLLSVAGQYSLALKCKRSHRGPEHLPA